MDILSLIFEALKTQTAGNVLVVAGIYIVSPMTVHLWIQFAKREHGRRRYSNLSIRVFAVLGTMFLSLLIGWRLGGWALEDAFNHAVLVAISYPLMMWFVMCWLKAHYIDAYHKLAHPRRPNAPDGLDHDETWQSD